MSMKPNEDKPNNQLNEIGEDDWQSDLSVSERNWYMLQNELETDVTFQVSSPQNGRVKHE